MLKLHCKEGAQHKVYMVNYHTSPCPFLSLYDKKVGACGTIRTNRKYYPKELVVSSSSVLTEPVTLSSAEEQDSDIQVSSLSLEPPVSHSPLISHPRYLSSPPFSLSSPLLQALLPLPSPFTPVQPQNANSART